MDINHNWLPVLAEQIRKAHADVLASTRNHHRASRSCSLRRRRRFPTAAGFPG
jgi:hypothetical protein